MASKNDLNVSNIELVQEPALANEDIALPVENPDLPIVESSSPNGYSASAIVVHPITNGGNLVSNGHCSTRNSVQLPTNGAHIQSNGHSASTNDEEDFVTRPEHVHDRAVQVLLQNWPVLENVKQRFEEEKIDYCQLASLVDEDLRMLGVEDVQTQREMVVVFSQLANQNDKKLIKEKLQLLNQNYSLALIDSMLVHLKDMNDVLAATALQIELSPPDDVIINRKYHASEVVLKIIAKMIEIIKRFSHVVRGVEYLEKPLIPEEETKPVVILPKIFQRVRRIKTVPRGYPVFYNQQRPIYKPLAKSLILSIGVFFLLRRVLRGKL